MSGLKDFAVATNQVWKYRVFLLLTAVWIVTGFLAFSRLHGNPLELPQDNAFDQLTFLFSSLALAWYPIAVRCPRCKKSPMWYEMTHTSIFDSKTGFSQTGVCPICGFDPTSPRLKQESNEVTVIEP